MGVERERLQRAYEATAYRVSCGPERRITIRVGAVAPEVDVLLEATGADCWAFVTAANPRSVRLAVAENEARMVRLAARLRERGLAQLPGEGASDDSGWPAEPSVLILGITQHEAVSLAAEFDQHAIVVGRRGEPARLAWVDSTRAAPSGDGRPQAG